MFRTMNTTKCSLLAAAVLGVGTLITVTPAMGASGPGGTGDYLVTVGKRPVWASQLPANQVGTLLSPVTITSTATTPGGAGDYLVTVGKRTVWASQAPMTTYAVAPDTSGADCQMSGFVTAGKVTQWTAGCTMCAAGASGGRACKQGAMTCPMGMTMSSARMTACCK